MPDADGLHLLVEMHPIIAVVRSAKEDDEAFARLAAASLKRQDYDYDPAEWVVAPPEWGWFRINPCNCGEHAWHIATVDGPGRGRWRGSYVRVMQRSTAVSEPTGGP
jgi:hypothetical protein